MTTLSQANCDPHDGGGARRRWVEREGRPEREAPITALLRQAGSWGVRGAAFYAPLACRSSRLYLKGKREDAIPGAGFAGAA